MFQIKVIQKIKTHTLCSLSFFSENCVIYETMSKKRGGIREVTNYITIWCIRIAHWISKATCAHAHAHAYAPRHLHARTCVHTKICNLIAFPQQRFANTPQHYVTCKLAVLLLSFYWASLNK